MTESQTFDDLLLNVLRSGLKEVMGESAARAMGFYVDPHIALRNIREYEAALRKIFGEGAALLERKCAEKLYAALKLPAPSPQNMTLAGCVLDAKSRLGLL